MKSPTTGRISIRKFSEALAQLYEPQGLEQYPERLFEVVDQLLPGVRMTFDKVNARTGAVSHARSFEVRNADEWEARLADIVPREHPVIPYLSQGGPERVLRLSELIPRRQLLRTELYNELLHPEEISQQLLAILPIPGHYAGLVMNRDRDFRAYEMEILRLLRPHIVRSHRHAQMLTEIQSTGLIRSVAEAPQSAADHGLTDREAEILYWIAQGKRDREIGIILEISPKTVGKHVEHILAKMQAPTRTAAAARYQT